MIKISSTSLSRRKSLCHHSRPWQESTPPDVVTISIFCWMSFIRHISLIISYLINNLVKANKTSMESVWSVVLKNIFQHCFEETMTSVTFHGSLWWWFSPVSDFYDYHNDYNNDANGFHLCQLIFFSIKLELAICNPVCHPDNFDHSTNNYQQYATQPSFFLNNFDQKNH